MGCYLTQIYLLILQGSQKQLAKNVDDNCKPLFALLIIETMPMKIGGKSNKKSAPHVGPPPCIQKG